MTGVTSEALRCAVALITADRDGLDVTPGEIIGDVPPGQVIAALVSIATAVLDALPADGATLSADPGSMVLAQVGLQAATQEAGPV